MFNGWPGALWQSVMTHWHTLISGLHNNDYVVHFTTLSFEFCLVCIFILLHTLNCLLFNLKSFLHMGPNKKTLEQNFISYCSEKFLSLQARISDLTAIVKNRLKVTDWNSVKPDPFYQAIEAILFLDSIDSTVSCVLQARHIPTLWTKRQQ